MDIDEDNAVEESFQDNGTAMNCESKDKPIMTTKDDDLNHLRLSRVKLTTCVLGRGSYGTVYKAEHNGIPCAVKSQDSGPTIYVVEKVKQNFLLECLRHSKVRHPNIVKMLGVFYPKEAILPVLVMELMENNLTQLLENHQNICMYVKLSILQDVSRGLCYLHTQNPPVVHQALYSDNILLTKGLIAKIGDFKIGGEIVSDQVVLSVRRDIRSNDFLPDPDNVLKYEPPLNVFSFGCVACHVITQKWPSIQHRAIRVHAKSTTAATLATTATSKEINTARRKRLATTVNWSVKKHRNYIDQISDNSLKQLVVACLQWKAKNRPCMSVIEERITSIMTDHCTDDNIKNLVMKQGLDQCMNFQLMLFGLENTGKTSLICNFLGEEFVEGRSTTREADIEVCKVYCKDWVRISHLDKSKMLHRQFSDHCKDEVLKTVTNSYIQSSPKSEYKSDSFIASLWDFTGQTDFHNSHSVFISDSGVSVITFNASLESKDQSIHYWLQVVNSMCSVKENVLLVGTHIDKLHPDLKRARNIARSKILPALEKELCGKPYAQHIAGICEGLMIALKQSCFFVSNKCRDEEIANLQAAAVRVATSLREEKPIFFLEIERALLQLNKQVISVSTMLDLVAANGFSFNKNSSEFKGVLKYFHNNRIILHFSQIESLKDLVILSPNWLAKLFSYIIAAHSYKTGGTSTLDWAWKRLTKYGILHECLIQHMLNRFNLGSLDSIRVTKKQAVDILLHFHLLARITSNAWFAEEGYLQLPERGDTFIVPSLVRVDDRNPPETEQERIIYFLFNNGFIPISLLNQVIAECVCRSVRRNDRLLWMRRGKMGSQLGTDQKYYISRCEEKQSIQLTITVVGNDNKHIEERRDLINDITKILDDIMKVHMPATKERPSLLIPCEFCSVLHVPLEDACSGDTIFCPNANDKSLAPGYYSELFGNATVIADVGRKLEVFTSYYYKLYHLDFKALGPHLVTATIISCEDHIVLLETTEPSKAASLVLNKILASLKGDTDATFDNFLSILKNHPDSFCKSLAEQIIRDLSKSTTVVASSTMEQPFASYQDNEKSYEKTTGVSNLSNTGKPILSRQDSYEELNFEDYCQMSPSQGVGYTNNCNLM